MRRGAGKEKGNQFERDVSRLLSLWISAGADSNLLWRSQSSGGRATIAAAKGIHLDNQDGDISSTNPGSAEFSRNFVIECKFYQSLGIEQFVFSGAGPLCLFWTQVVRDSGRTGKVPLLIARQNRRPTVVLTDARLGACFPGRKIHFSHVDAYLFDFKELLLWNYEDALRQLQPNRRRVLLRRPSSSPRTST